MMLAADVCCAVLQASKRKTVRSACVCCGFRACCDRVLCCAVLSVRVRGSAPAVLLDYINKVSCLLSQHSLWVPRSRAVSGCQQNKPYSAVNIFDNLHKAVKRAHVNRVLDKLAAQGKIKMKMYKKFKLYFPDQVCWRASIVAFSRP